MNSQRPNNHGHLARPTSSVHALPILHFPILHPWSVLKLILDITNISLVNTTVCIASNKTFLFS